MVNLILAYKQKLKLSKPVKSSRQWTNEAVENGATNLVSFCENSYIPSYTRVSYNNDKLWFTATLRKLRLEKEEVFCSGDRECFNVSKYRFIRWLKGCI